ncbi:MAG: tetratricopeptide repeat protein, partial [Candidatus Pelagibacter sp. TMED165]
KNKDGYIIDSLGWALFKLKKYKEAKKYLEQAVIFMPSDPVVNDHFGDVLWMNNNTLQARYYWNYVLNLEETDEELKSKIKNKLVLGLNTKNL